MPSVMGVVTPNESITFDQYGREVQGCDWSIDMYAHCGFCPTIINKYFDSYSYTNIDEYYLCRNCGLAYL
jgi:hypothetical protein